jgi:hypothetical protein
MYFAVGLLEGEVYNGGFHQYFFNSSGSYYAVTVRGLMAIEAHQSLSLLREAKEHLFPKKSVPADTATRRRALPDESTKLDELDKIFWKDPDGLPSRMGAFARKHGLVRVSGDAPPEQSWN